MAAAGLLNIAGVAAELQVTPQLASAWHRGPKETPPNSFVTNTGLELWTVEDVTAWHDWVAAEAKAEQDARDAKAKAKADATAAKESAAETKAPAKGRQAKGEAA
jgi:hypothetical protein